MMGFRFSFAPLLALLVFAICAGIVWLAHIEAGEMTVDRRPPLVKAATTPLKRAPDDPGGRAVADLGGVGDLLRDQPAAAEERLLPKPEQPIPPSGNAALEAEGRSEASAALEALVSEIRGGRPVGGQPGLGEANADQFVTIPSPSKPARNAGVTSTDTVTGRASAPRPAAVAPSGETEIAAVSPIFEASPDGRFRVQLAAVREERDAKRAWDIFQQQLGPFIDGLQPFFERAETSNGVFYRVQVGPFADTEEAGQLCVELKKQNASCFVVSR